MKKNTGLITNILYRFFHAGLLACLLLFMAGSYLGIAEYSFVHVAVMLLLIAVLTCITYLKLRGRVLIILGVVGGLTIAVWVTGFGESISFLQNYFNWLLNDAGWNEEWLKFYELLQAGVMAIICLFFQSLMEKYAPLKNAGALLLLVWLLICMFTKRTFSHISMVFAFAYLVIIFVEGIQNCWKKIKGEDVRRYILWIMPFLAVYLMLMCFTPAPEKAYEWTFVKSAYENIVRACKILGQDFLRGDGEDFGLTMTGFSEEGLLKGTVSKSNEEVMTIKGQPGAVSNIYLMGKVFNSFDGRGWEQTDESTEEERLLDTLETVYAAERYGQGNIRNYIYSTSAHVKFRYFKTGYLFTPLKTYSVTSRNTSLNFTQEGGNLLLDKRKGYGTEYDFSFYQMNVDHPEFYRFVETELVDDEEVFHEIRRKYQYSDGAKIELADLEAHRQQIYEKYLQEVQLSQEMKAYLAEITQGAETDIERLKAIEKALSSLTYLTDTGNLPQEITNEEDFLDYFVLEKKEGYCTYFATAFVLLARAEGIPARYVQGFCIPVEENKETIVYSHMAHAWPEVYIDGAGWIPFEPTPGYAEIRYTPWKMQETTQSDESMLEGAGQGVHYWEEEPTPSALPEFNPEELEIQNQNDGRLGVIIGYTILLIIVVCVLMVIIDGMTGSYRYRRMNLIDKYKIQIKRNLRVLAQLGYERKEQETLTELRNRVSWLLEENQTDLKELQSLCCYEELLYGNRVVTEPMLATALTEQNKLMRLLKEKTKRAYLFYKIKLYLLRYR